MSRRHGSIFARRAEEAFRGFRLRTRGRGQRWSRSSARNTTQWTAGGRHWRMPSSRSSKSEQAVRGVPGPDALENLMIFGDLAVTEARIEMALVLPFEDRVEALIE